MTQVNIYILSSNNGPRKADGTVIYILEAETSKGPATKTNRVPFKGLNSNESLLDGLIDALGHIVKPCEINVFTTSGYLYCGITQWMKLWNETGWKNAKGKEIANQKKWARIADFLCGRPLTATLGNHQYLSWLKNEVKNG